MRINGGISWQLVTDINVVQRNWKRIYAAYKSQCVHKFRRDKLKREAEKKANAAKDAKDAKDAQAAPDTAMGDTAMEDTAMGGEVSASPASSESAGDGSSGKRAVLPGMLDGLTMEPAATKSLFPGMLDGKTMLPVPVHKETEAEKDAEPAGRYNFRKREKKVYTTDLFGNTDELDDEVDTELVLGCDKEGSLWYVKHNVA